MLSRVESIKYFNLLPKTCVEISVGFLYRQVGVDYLRRLTRVSLSRSFVDGVSCAKEFDSGNVNGVALIGIQVTSNCKDTSNFYRP